MNRQLQKILSGLVPKSEFKEIVKLWFYNLKAGPGLSFHREPNGVYKIKLKTGMIRSYQPYYHFIQELGYYEHFYQVKEGDTVIDAGANAGLLSLYCMLKVQESGCVYAFEPDEINCKKLLLNIGLNAGPKNCILQKELLWNKETELEFNEAGTEGSSALWIPDRSAVVKKRATTIDHFVDEQQLKKLDFVKMDIEGAEIEAMEGCVETMQNFQPNFAIASYHIVNGNPTYLALESFFKKRQYPFKTVLFGKNEFITFAGPAIEGK